MRWYEPFPAPGDLSAILACSWTATPSGRHRLVPDACVELLWLSSGPVILCGPETSAWTFELPASTSAVGVRFRPGAAATVLGLDVSTIRNRRVRWAEIATASAEARLSAAIGAGVRSGVDMPAGVRLLEDEVRRASRSRGAADDGIVESILTSVSHPAPVSHAAIAARLGLSPRQLHRRSLSLFGFGTSTLARLLRLQRLLSIRTTSGELPLAQLAWRAGYSDQAHLNRDCRSIVGLTPTAFLAEYFPTFPDMSDPFKTSGREPVTLRG